MSKSKAAIRRRRMCDFAESRRSRQRGRSPTVREDGLPTCTPSLTVGLLPRVTELLILQKHVRVVLLKKYQTHFIQLMIGA